MKYALVIIAILLLLIGGWYFFIQSDTDTNADGALSGDSNPLANENSSDGNGISVDVGADVSAEADVVVSLTGQPFAFSQTEIRVKEGDVVRINFSSAQGTHDWVVDEFDARTAVVNTGGSSSVTFTANKAGEFEYYCSVGSHRELGMVGKLIVE